MDYFRQSILNYKNCGLDWIDVFVIFYPLVLINIGNFISSSHNSNSPFKSNDVDCFFDRLLRVLPSK